MTVWLASFNMLINSPDPVKPSRTISIFGEDLAKALPGFSIRFPATR